MDKRTLLIVAGLAVPLVMLTMLAHPGSHAPKKHQAANGYVETLQEARTRLKNRLDQLEKMTPAEWPAERRKHPRAPKTLQQARAKTKHRLAELNAMTPEQWQEKHPGVPQSSTPIPATGAPPLSPEAPPNNATPASPTSSPKSAPSPTQ